jgi:hypothetical protein
MKTKQNKKQKLRDEITCCSRLKRGWCYMWASFVGPEEEQERITKYEFEGGGGI